VLLRGETFFERIYLTFLGEEGKKKEMAMAVAVGVEAVKQILCRLVSSDAAYRTAEQSNVFFRENNKLRIYIHYYRSP